MPEGIGQKGKILPLLCVFVMKDFQPTTFACVLVSENGEPLEQHII